MRRLLLFAAALLAGGRIHAETALDAIRELPKDSASRLVKVEARGGTPEPERWYILTQDPAAENGVHEFVIAHGEIVASRAVSQFAESLKPEDMLGSVPLKIDSDKAAKLAHDFAEANGVVIAGVNYELKRDGTDAAPAWTISCLDEKGNKVGSVVVTAGKGNVVSHEGFALEPDTGPGAGPKKGGEHFDTYAKPEIAPGAVTDGTAQTDGTNVAASESGRSGRRHVEKKPADGIGKTFQDVGRTLHKILPF